MGHQGPRFREEMNMFHVTRAFSRLHIQVAQLLFQEMWSFHWAGGETEAQSKKEIAHRTRQ